MPHHSYPRLPRPVRSREWRAPSAAAWLGAIRACDDVGMLPLALVREVERCHLNRSEKMKLKKLAKDAGLSPSNYLRALIGLPERPAGRPSIEQLEREADEAWNTLKDMGEDPAAYFPPSDSWLDDYR